MWFRCRVYSVVPERLDLFNELFECHLLPIQRRHGATLVARIASQERDRVVALWSYESREHYERVQLAVRKDPDLTAALAFRDKHGFPLSEKLFEFFGSSTVSLDLTAFSK